jgi:hypothetical protein
VQKDIGAAVATLYTRDRSGGTPQPAGDVGDKVEWSPDGAKLVFDRGGDLYTSNPDGTARLQLTSTPQAERNADWQPVPTTTYPGYARPKEAALLDVSLVPTYVPCALRPNRTHGPPLAYSSCNPPRLFSRYLTMGTPDANGLPAETSGNLRLTVRAGDLATQANEADVRIRFSVNGVRCQYNFFSTACRNANGSPGGLLYDGGLDLELKFQLTDRFNLPSERGRGPGTTGKLLLEFGPYCDLGTCAQNTSVNALMGPVAREGRRAVWELDAIMVRDEQYPRGPLRSFFLTQGVFVP